jgi:hypothetical protein
MDRRARLIQTGFTTLLFALLLYVVYRNPVAVVAQAAVFAGVFYLLVARAVTWKSRAATYKEEKDIR